MCSSVSRPSLCDHRCAIIVVDMEDNPWDGIDGETLEAISRRSSEALASWNARWHGVAGDPVEGWEPSVDMFALVADDGWEGFGRLRFCGASLLWEMYKDGHDQTRDRSWQKWWHHHHHHHHHHLLQGFQNRLWIIVRPVCCSSLHESCSRSA